MVNYLQNKENKLGVKGDKLLTKDRFDPFKLIKLIRDLSLILASSHIIYYVWAY